MVITSYKCDFCGKEYKENKVNCYIVGKYEWLRYEHGSERKFKEKDMCDECRNKLLKCIVDLGKQERG